MTDETETEEPAYERTAEEVRAGLTAADAQAAYIADILAGNAQPPAFTYVAEDGSMSDYTLDEVLASDESTVAKVAWLRQQIEAAKASLAATDYIAIKLAEGAATADEYAEQITERQQLRDLINSYEDAIASLEG